MRQPEERDLCDLRDEDEFLHRVVGQVLGRIGIGHQRRRGRKEERVAVRRRTRRRLRADNVSTPRAVFDDHRLADPRRELVSHDPADDVGRAAGRLRTDELHRPVGPGRGPAGGRHAQRIIASPGGTP